MSVRFVVPSDAQTWLRCVLAKLTAWDRIVRDVRIGMLRGVSHEIDALPVGAQVLAGHILDPRRHGRGEQQSLQGLRARSGGSGAR